MSHITLNDVRAALTLDDFDPSAAQMRMAPMVRPPSPERVGAPPREAGVLVLLYPHENELSIVLTRRTDTLRGHSGQISFPGGRRDPEDPDFTHTALRETCEELGLCEQTPIQVLGSLTRTYIPPSHFHVYPTVAHTPQILRFEPNTAEVAEVFPLSLRDLLTEATKASEPYDIMGKRVQVPFYRVNHHKIWGATAIMLSEFEQRLRQVLPEDRLAALD